jgi:dTDP-4-dehydrorhamnose reductase
VKTLVFGAAGQVGCEVFRAAWPRSFELLPFDKNDGDITDPDAVAAVIAQHRPNLVINLAAYTAVDRAESEPERAWAVNCDGAANIAAACREAAAPLIHLSTDYVFDGCKSGPYREEDGVNPINAYGRGKEAGERAVRAAIDRYVILRTSWIFGAYGSNFVKTVLRLGGERPVLQIVGDQYGCPTAAADIASALITIARRIDGGGTDWGIFHFAGMGRTTWYGFAEEIVQRAAAFGAWRGASQPRVEQITTNQYKTPARRPMNSELDCRKIASTLGISPPPWRSSLAAVLRELVGETSG